jgi:hypothetical protein
VSSKSYFKVSRGSGRADPGDYFVFDGDSVDGQAAALAAARQACGKTGRVVAWRRPRFAGFDGGIVGEVSEACRAPEPRWFEPGRGDPPN